MLTLFLSAPYPFPFGESQTHCSNTVIFLQMRANEVFRKYRGDEGVPKETSGPRGASLSAPTLSCSPATGGTGKALWVSPMPEEDCAPWRSRQCRTAPVPETISLLKSPLTPAVRSAPLSRGGDSAQRLLETLPHSSGSWCNRPSIWFFCGIKYKSWMLLTQVENQVT